MLINNNIISSPILRTNSSATNEIECRKVCLQQADCIGFQMKENACHWMSEDKSEIDQSSFHCKKATEGRYFNLNSFFF